MSNIDKWKKSHEGRMDIKMYGSSMTYELAAEFLDDCDTIEDWGSGRGGLTLFRKKSIVGVDGTKTPFVDVIADLCEYTSDADGILIRHVLEHNWDWRKILENAIESFRKKLCVVLFIPLSDKGTYNVEQVKGVDIPNLSICKNEFIDCLGTLEWEKTDRLHTDANYRNEHVFYIIK